MAARIRGLTPFEQVVEVLELEKQGIWFAKDLTKSIIYSVAPPGASQHLSLLAFDVKEFDDPKIRDILAKHRWYQTVTSDLPHFTYLGVEESELSRLGLRKISDSGRTFWINSDKTLLDYVHPEDREHMIASTQTALSNANKVVDREYRLQAKDGTYRHIRERVTFIPDDGTGQPRAEGLQMDITCEELTTLRPTKMLADRTYPIC